MLGGWGGGDEGEGGGPSSILYLRILTVKLARRGEEENASYGGYGLKVSV